jgi:hypothetical protein
MIRATAVLLVVGFGFVLGASAQDFKVPESRGRWAATITVNVT